MYSLLLQTRIIYLKIRYNNRGKLSVAITKIEAIFLWRYLDVHRREF